jgi:predicted aminopeptidase
MLDERAVRRATGDRAAAGSFWQRAARLCAVAAAVASAVGCGGCSPLYVLHSAVEEGRILWRREPIEEVLARPDLDPETRDKLELILAVRRFAGDRLGLQVGGAYGSFAEVSPGALLYVLSAADRTELRAYEWWFPIVGSVNYKGFFARSDADAEAHRLEGEGFDTYVRGSVAFSSLGWFDDPVLSNWLRADRERIADLVIHELLHRTIYLRGETNFNESFANFVGHRGAIAFFLEKDGPTALTTGRAMAEWQAELAESDQWTAAVGRLRELYARGAADHEPLDQILDGRKAVFAELGDPDQVNNATIISKFTYLDRLASFEAVYSGSGDDLRATIAKIRTETEGAKDPFMALASAAVPKADSSVGAP